MSNDALTSYCIGGDKEQLKSLYDTMHSLELSITPLKEDIIDSQSLINLAVALGADYQSTFCSGYWHELLMSKDGSTLIFKTDSFKHRPEKIEKLIKIGIRSCIYTLDVQYHISGFTIQTILWASISPLDLWL